MKRLLQKLAQIYLLASLISDHIDLLKTFSQNGVQYVVIGGMAMNLHGFEKGTTDLDIIVDSSAENSKRVYASLVEFGIPARMFGLTPDTFETENFRMGRGSGKVEIFSDSGLLPFSFEEIRDDAELIDYGGISIPTISKEKLIKSKQEAGRDKDFYDIEQLQEIKTAAQHRRDFLDLDYKITQPNLNELEYDEAVDVYNAATFYVKNIRDKSVTKAFEKHKGVENFLATLADYIAHSGSNTEIDRMKAFSSQGDSWPLLPEVFRDNWEIFQKALKARIKQAVDSIPEDEQVDIEVDIYDDEPPDSEEIDIVFDDEEAPMSQRAPMTQRSILARLNKIRAIIK